MLLYVNGDEISGGACCVNDFVQADDDYRYVAQADKAHPDNIMHSYGYYLSRLYNLGFRCEANIKQDNQQIYNSSVNFIKNVLPLLRSNYTLMCIGWMPGVTNDILNDLHQLATQNKIEIIFFNTKKPLIKSAELKFSNLIDLKDENECFINWCKNRNHVLKNGKYPDAQAHNAWAKYIFSKAIEVL